MRADALDGAIEDDWLVEREGNLLEEACAYLGCPYEWGGLTETGIDCSGLIHMAYPQWSRRSTRRTSQPGPGGTCSSDRAPRLSG